MPIWRLLEIGRWFAGSHPRLKIAGLFTFLCLLGASSLRGTDYTVAITNDDLATGSLSWAITAANMNPATAPHRILFNLPTNTTTIILTNGPTVVVPMLIDGSSQPNFTGQPIVELRGADANSGSGVILSGASSNIIVRSLVINRFTNDGVTIQNAGGNVVEGCYIGTDRTGTNVLANAQYGILISSSPRNIIGGTNASQRNVIAGFTAAAGLRPAIGLLNAGAAGNVIQGNYIGIGADGVTRVGRGYGVHLESSPSNQIGGTVTGSGNVISGNDATGVFLHSTGANGNVVQGNIIGLNPAGSLAVSNGADGVTVEGGSGNVIGGTESGSGNVISGNAWGGIHIKALTGAGGTNNMVQGNFIGTDSTGRSGRGNGSPGVTITGVSGSQIGGTNAAARNIISGNITSGVLVNTNCTGNWIQGNLIGVDATGTNALGNGTMGVAIDSAFGNTVGGSVAGTGNVISGNSNHGVFLTGATATNNTVAGNLIGTDVTGGKALKNAVNGVHVFSPGNWIGGTTAAARNVISGNGADGVFLDQSASSGTTIQGNYIGTDATGTKRLGNTVVGIRVFASATNTIGGTASGARNIVSANGSAGIYLVSNTCACNVIQGNYIGTDLTGTAALGNADTGIYFVAGVSNTIGGSVAGAGNLISGVNYWGLRFTANASWNTVQGNRVGTKADGVSALPNTSHGIDLESGCANNILGGATANAGNILAFAPGLYSGVRVRDGATNNAILGNSIFSNGRLGIDLGTYGIDANDNCDGDGGANQQQNFPVLQEAQAGSNVWVRGSLNSIPNRTYLVQFFANPTVDSSGYGEGEIFLGNTWVALGGSCSTNFTCTLPVAVPVGYWISATATDPANNTSEFAACIQASAADTTPPSITNCPAAITTNSLPGQCGAAVTWIPPTAGDNNGLASFTSDRQPGTIFPVGTTLVTYTALDTRSNMSQCTFTVTVLDNQPPTITAPSNVAVVAAPEQCSSTNVTLGAPTTSDNCGVAIVTNNAPLAFPLGDTLVTWTAIDLHGNSASSTQKITVTIGPPAILAQPQSVTNVAGTDANFTVAVASCGGSQPAPSWQWFFSSTNLLAGATNATLTISNVQPVHAGDYAVVVHNAAGSVTSLVARLTVLSLGVVTGRVELEAFVGTQRIVTFLATDQRGSILKTWNLPLVFTSSVALYTLPDVPLAAVGLSAKTEWTLRQKLPLVFALEHATVDFQGDKALPGGDFDDSNTCDMLDYFILAGAWYTHDPTADIDGNGRVDLDDYFLLAFHWYAHGDPE